MKSDILYFNEATGKFTVSDDPIKNAGLVLDHDFKEYILDIFKAFLGDSHKKEVFQGYSNSDMIKEYHRFKEMRGRMAEMGYIFYAP